MKKIIFILIFLLLSLEASAMVGIGLHGGLDLISIGKVNKEFRVKIDGERYKYSVKRGAIEEPKGFGLQFYFDIPAFIDLGIEADVHASYEKYSWVAPNRAENLSGGDDIVVDIGEKANEDGYYEEEYYFARVGADLTAKYYFLNIPPVVDIASFYVGGGCGMHFVTPIVSEKFFIKEIKKNFNQASGEVEMDIEELVEKNTVFGMHLVAGVRVKPPVIPLAVNLDYKYLFLPENDYGDDTDRFGQVKLGLSFYF